MIDRLRRSRWRISVVASDLLNLTPIRQEPSLEIMLRNVGMKTVILANPYAHFGFSISGVQEILCASVYVG